LRNIDVRKQATNDKLPGSVATCLRCGGVVNNQIEKGLLPSLPLEKIKVGQYLASYKEEGGCLVDFVHMATISLKVEESERHNPPLLPVTMPDFFLIKNIFLNNGQKLTYFNNFWYVKILRKFDVNTLHICLPPSPVSCSHLTLGNPKRHFLSLLFIYFRLFTLPKKKINSNCCTAA